MRRILTGIAALALSLAVLPAFADDKKDPAPDAKPPDAATNNEKTIKAGTVAGKVLDVNETAKSLKVEVIIEYAKPNIGELQAYQQAQINYANALARRDVNGALSAQRDMAYHAARTTSVEKKTQNVDITSSDDLKVRMAEPPPAYDDKGNIRKRTQKELDELKGDPKSPDYKLPGYPAQFSDLRQGVYVKVSLVKKKEAHPSGTKPKDGDADPLGDNMPQASIIEIIGDANPAK
ncbi:MAG TPA: hypothetical protein VMS17_02240 [Gemmataceae bacterium]|nr:hypothetical protein [Gemmataceae bacterium]